MAACSWTVKHVEGHHDSFDKLPDSAVGRCTIWEPRWSDQSHTLCCLQVKIPFVALELHFIFTLFQSRQGSQQQLVAKLKAAVQIVHQYSAFNPRLLILKFHGRLCLITLCALSHIICSFAWRSHTHCLILCVGCNSVS